jgi:molybdopterin molybdotransferase
MPHLTPLAEAIDAALRLGRAVVLGSEDVALTEAVGRTTASPVLALQALPSFSSSAMDGFAVRAADLADATPERPIRLPVAAESRAGEPADRPLGPGRAIRIATGAVVPSGADAIVPYEAAEEDDDGGERFTAAPLLGAFVRAAGTDVSVGDELIASGVLIEPHHLAALAGSGFSSITARRRPRVSILHTGDEVVSGAGPHAALPPGAVHDVNGVVLPALVRSWGAEVAEVVAVPDSLERTTAAIRGSSGDVVVVCGGLSMGPHDHVRPALTALGARQDLFRIALQPGKPTWLGVLPRGADGPERPVFGLPGNPASVFVTATLLLRSSLEAMSGRPAATPVRGRLAEATEALPDRTAARRARAHLDETGVLRVEILEGQASHLLGSLGRADALAIVPAGTNLPAGAAIDVVQFGAGSGPSPVGGPGGEGVGARGEPLP